MAEKEYIEREALKKKLGDLHFPNYGYALIAINEMPAADVVEVKHGKWKYCCTHNNKKYYRCSVCHYSYLIYENTQYCQHCGVKMDGKGDL
ncbi:MAG: hypothetical protein E7536_09155 [Ruminococcaceae bacterium]|nr:hypothetical protein [Oscillospiraceae bacterium]